MDLQKQAKLEATLLPKGALSEPSKPQNPLTIPYNSKPSPIKPPLNPMKNKGAISAKGSGTYRQSVQIEKSLLCEVSSPLGGQAREERTDKEVHVMKVEEYVEQVDEGELLVLKRALSMTRV